jgi:hypothetical protein
VILPKGAYVKVNEVKIKKKEETDGKKLDPESESSTVLLPEPKPEIIIMSKSGRKVKLLSDLTESAQKSKRKLSNMVKMNVDGGEVSGKDKNDWHCAMCYGFEASGGSDLLLCDGPCLRSFHLECVGLNKNDVRMNKKKKIDILS